MTATRRELLQAALAGTAVLACPAPSQRTPEIAFVGPDPARGHRLRDAALRGAAPSERLTTKIAIVGAGVSGLAAAWRLQRAGLRDLVLLELEDDTGGTARGGSLPRSAYPMGAHYLPVPRSGFAALEALLDDLGLVTGRDENGRREYDARAICRAPVERHRHLAIWHEGLYPAAGQTGDEAAQWERFRGMLRELDGRVGADGRRLFDLPVSRSSTELRGLDEISMATWLDQHGLTSWRLRWLVDYGMRDDYGCTIDHISAFAALHHFLARGLEDTHDRVLLTWPEGNAALTTGMAALADLGDRLRLGWAVHSIEPDTGELIAHDLAAGRDIAIAAEVVLWAAPRFVLRHVLPRGTDPLGADELGYAPWLVANVEVDQAPKGTGAPLSWDNVAIDGDHLGYVVANHLEPLDRRRTPGAVLTWYEPRPAADPDGLRVRRAELLAMDEATAGAHVLAGLSSMHPGIEAHVRTIHVTRWGHGMIRPVPGLLFGPALARARAPIGRVIPCAADVGGLPLFEQAFALGVDAAEQALVRLGRPTPSML